MDKRPFNLQTGLLMLGLNLFLLPAIGQDYMTRIAVKSCACVAELDTDQSQESLTIEFGFCILEAALPYEKQLKRDHDIELDRIEEQGQELGMLVGMEMASICPDELMILTGEAEEEIPEDEFLMLFEGEVTKIQSEQFVVFSVKNIEGKVLKFHWLTFISSDIELSENYKSLLGKDVRIYYEEYEFFDPRLDAYRDFNLIDELELIGLEIME